MKPNPKFRNLTNRGLQRLVLHAQRQGWPVELIGEIAFELLRRGSPIEF